jgi:hypothetical protein
MSNRIVGLHAWNPVLNPAHAEVWVSVALASLASTTEVRGRLMGPRCVYTTTVEVAYPWREAGRQYASEGNPRLDVRAIIPEPNFWDPESPFLYQGPLELWQDGRRWETVTVRHGLRSFQLGPAGLRLNGRPLALRGLSRTTCTEAEARALHQAGWNTLLAPATPEAAGLWDLGDRFGFLLLGRVADQDRLRQAFQLQDHPCTLGWVVTLELLQDPVLAAALPNQLAGDGRLVGVEIQRKFAPPLPQTFSFVAGERGLLASLGDDRRPRLVWGDDRTGPDGHPPESAGSAPELGWIARKEAPGTRLAQSR